MIISVINKKGGVGKTSFAFSIAKDLDMYLQSNDASVIESIYSNKAKIVKEPQLCDNCVFDFGGFVSSGVLEIAKESDFVLIPCISHYNCILRTIETINEIKAVNDKILILNTNFIQENAKKQVENLLNEKFENLQFFSFRQSKILENSTASACSFLELANETPLARASYRNFISEYERLLKTLKNI